MDKKWNLQDIKPAGRKERPERPRPAQSQPPSSGAVDMQTPTARQDDDDASTLTIPVESGKRKRSRSIVTVAVVLLVVFGGIIAASFFTRGADITVYPRHREPNINATFTAYAEATSPEQLSYEVMTLEAEGERQVRASGQQPVSEQATGVITIYKSTPGTQRLITNTRFEDGQGQIFRLVDSAVVPGAVDGQPGSIQAEVFASEPGESYNAPAGTRFTIPGLESDPNLFNAMYADNEAAFTGGFEGTRFIIDEGELATAQQGLREELRDALLQRLPNEQPANMITFLSATAFIYESLPAVEYGDDLATIKERAVLQIPLFAEDELAAFLAAAAVPGYENMPVRIENPESLSFSYTSATTSRSNIANATSLSFELEGRPTIVWTYDEGKLATDLLGANRTALNQVLQAYPAIERAQATIRPFWQRTFPSDINLISIAESLNDPNDE